MAKIVVKRAMWGEWRFEVESKAAFFWGAGDLRKRRATAIRHAEAFRAELGATEETLPIEVEE